VMLGQDELTYNFSGFADTYHAVRSKEPYDFMSSRSRLRTEFEVSRGRSFLFASLNSVYNSLLTEETGIELREAYLQYTTNHWDFKAGRQIVIWGVADGLRITDIVSPMDMSEFLAREYDDIRIPVNAFKLKCFNSKVSAEAIFIPVSSFFIISTSGNNPWSILPTAEGLYYEADLEDYPEKTLDNSEVGARMSFYLPGIDFSISALHTWNKMPVLGYEYSSNNDTAFVYGQYDRMDMLGADLSVPFGEFVFRGEVAEYFGELQETIVATENIKRNTTNFLVGIDWYPGGDWTVTAQYSHKLIPGHVDVLANKANTAFTTLGITKKVIRSTLNLSTFTYFDIANRGLFNRTSADYSLTDQIRLMAGYDWFHGDKGMFSLYGDNSEFWIKAKFGF
ncbi:MAG: hypothetical protein PVF73_10855, partial [Bacteroidales bacterium]